MDDVVKVGPFFIQYHILLIIIETVFGYITISFLMKRNQEKQRKVMIDLLFTTVMIPPLVWKFGPMVIQPYHLISHPILMLIVTRGTTLYWIIGSFLAIVYFSYGIWRYKINVFSLLDYFTFVSLASLILNNMLQWKYGLRTHLPWGISIHSSKFSYHPINIYNLIVLGLIIIWLIKKRYPMGSSFLFSNFLLGYGIGNMVVTFFSYNQLVLLEFSVQQWIDLIFIGIGWALPFIRSRIVPLEKEVVQ